MILALRTDKPEAELYLLEKESVKDSIVWQAHRELSDTIIQKIETLLKKNTIWFPDIRGIIVYQGPGSFTGLRIGITVANTLAYANNIPITGGQGEDWQKDGYKRLQLQKAPQVIVPHYGSEAHITQPRK